MSWLLTTATAEEARAKSGLNWAEWAKFYVSIPFLSAFPAEKPRPPAFSAATSVPVGP